MEAGLGRPARRFEHWAAFCILLFLVVANWYSLLQLGSYALGDTPVAFVAAVPLLAGYLMVHDWRARRAGEEQTDLFFDGVVFLALFIVCAVLLFVLPARLSWYYWLQRLDLLVLPLFAVALVFLFSGLGGISAVRSALLFLFLVWPYPLVLASQVLGPALVFLSGIVGLLVVKGLGLPVAVSAADPTRFVGTGAQRFTIVLAETCSGMNAMLGFLVIGLPLVLVWSGPRSRKVGWLATGMLAALASNLVRVGLLLYLATTMGVDIALGTVHPFLGAVLFAMVFLGMLGVARFFGIGFRGPESLRVSKSSRAGGRAGLAPRLWVAGLASAVLAVGQTTLAQFGPLNDDSLPAVPVGESWMLLPEMPGWVREWRPATDWQDLFGRDSQSLVALYRKGNASMVVQYVVAADKGALDRYSPEQCDLYHGGRLLGVSTVDIGHGIWARFVHTQLDRGEGQGEVSSGTGPCRWRSTDDGTMPGSRCLPIPRCCPPRSSLHRLSRRTCSTVSRSG